MIFAHNTFNRPFTLKKTINIEKRNFPNARFIITYNSLKIKSEIEELCGNNEDNTFIYYIGENKGHKLGSINCVMSALSYAYDIANDNEYIVFSHDDVYLSNINIFNEKLKILNMYDFVGRKYIGNKHNINNENYVMLESFIINENVVSKIIRNYNHNCIDKLPTDNRGSLCPEIYFGDLLHVNSINSFFIEILENMFGDNDMGYFHIENIRGKGDI